MLVVVYCFFNPSSSILFPVVHSGDKYINGEIIPCTYPTYQPKERRTSKYESRRYERRRDGPPANRKPRQQAPQTESASSWGRNVSESVHLHRLVPKLNHSSLLQFCRHLSTLYYWNKRARLILSALAQWRTSMHIHPQPKISGSVVQVTCTAWIWITWIGADILSRLWHLSLTRSEPDLSKMLLFSQLLVNYPSDALHDVGWPICIADLVKCVPFPLWALFEQLVFRAIALCLQSHYVLLEIAYWAIEGSESY